MQLPFISRKRHEAEINALRRSISKVCNTGCRTAKCQGRTGESIERSGNNSRVGHTVAHPGKRVLVTKHNGEQFVAKFKEKTGRFHLFHDHDPVRSASIRQLSILTSDYKETN